MSNQEAWDCLYFDFGGDRYEMIAHCTEYGISRREAYLELFGEVIDD